MAFASEAVEARARLDGLFKDNVSLSQLVGDASAVVTGDIAQAGRLASVFEVLGIG